MTDVPAAVCLAGPTASGKSRVALQVAQALGAEIVSVDSALVYRGMDVGTAKPSAAERAAVPHHLIDILDPNAAYSAARFVQDARACMADICRRGRIPLLVGGTMLYFKALQEGLDPLPAADPEVRRAIDALAAAEGWPAVHAELARVDPPSAQRLAPHDAQRLQRALEVYRLTGTPLSALQRQGRRSGPQPAAPPLLSLEPQDRAWLHTRIAARFEAMLHDGLLQEVQRLRARGDLHAALPSMRCVGYRQLWQALDANPALQQVPAAVAEQAIAATRQLAKRQLTWLRSMPQRTVIACDIDDPAPRVLRRVREAMAGSVLRHGKKG
jgi:tRNA dimethylallyltransferase